MLSFAEEIYLLSLDDVTGKLIVPSKEIILNSVLVGAVLGELSFLNKVDSDLKDLHILDTEPTNNPILDSTLESLKKMDTTKISISRCLNILLQNAKDIENQVLDRLIENAIVKKVEGCILWVIPTRRYPKIDDFQMQDVETRLRELILSDNIPEPREAVLVSLVHTCGLFGQILSPRELRRSEERIKTISKMDVVGRKVVQLIIDINVARASQFIM
jgi:golgi phosphoprotein 3